MDSSSYLFLRNKAFRLLEDNFSHEMRFSSALSNQPYWTHLLNVHCYLITFKETDKNVLIAALLHDIVEDSNITIDYISKNFNAQIAVMVSLLTKPKNFNSINELKFYNNILNSGNFGAMKIKVFDRIDNLLTNMAFNSDVKMVKNYIAETEKYFIPISKKVGLEKFLTSTICYIKSIN